MSISQASPQERRTLAASILAGFAANPAVFAANDSHGWSLVNSTDEDLVGYALSLADKVIDAERITWERERERENEE